MKTNLAQLFLETSIKYKDKPAFATRTASKLFMEKTYSETYNLAIELSTALIEMGVKPREHVGILADNRYEWMLADMAIILAGAADVPRGSDVTDYDIQYIINHADIKVLFVENLKVLQKILNLKEKLPGLKIIILMDKESKATEAVFHLYDLIQKGKVLRSRGTRTVEEHIAQIQPDDLFTLIYTSGTTGAPKGVMLTHNNIISQIRNLPMKIDSEDRILSILPVWHIFERIFEMISIANGCCTYYTNVKNFKEDLQIVKPTFMASAPRLWESIYTGIMNSLDKSSPFKKFLFQCSYFLAKEFHHAKNEITSKNLKLEESNILSLIPKTLLSIGTLSLTTIPYLLLDSIVLSKIRSVTGGNLKGSVSGGGALPFHVDLFFNNIGIPVLEGYGMTETCPIISVRNYDNLVVGTVGCLYNETELKLIDIHSGKTIFPAEDGYGKKGEIHIRGPQVMKGYYKNQEATEKVLKEGWINTGDIGIMTYNQCLKIVGRSKETIVLMGGENVEPVPIENRLLNSPYIDQCMVVGQDQKSLGALIVVNKDRLKEYGDNVETISKNLDAQTIITKEIKGLISSEFGFKSFERIVVSRLLPKAFEVGDELTAKLSIKRHVITEKYKDLIQDMYK